MYHSNLSSQSLTLGQSAHLFSFFPVFFLSCTSNDPFKISTPCSHPIIRSGYRIPHGQARIRDKKFFNHVWRFCLEFPIFRDKRVDV